MARMRSPNYPAVGLSEAVELARTIWKKEQRTSVPPEVVASAWGYRGLSGLPRIKMAALKKYGLLEQMKDGWRVSQRALQLFLNPPESPEYRSAIQSAARAPELFQELYSTHAKASDDAIRAHLITKKSFSASGARQFIKAFRETIEVAKPGESSYSPGDDNGAGNTKLAPGDLVEWESQGILQFDKPRKITGFSEDGTFAFVEGTQTGIPVQQLQKAEGAPPAPPQFESMREQSKPGIRREVFALDEGEAVLQWPAQLTPGGVAELKDWLNLVIRKVERISKGE